MKIINRQNGSTITGESGDNIGRGGRSGLYFKDESAFYERPEKIEAALSQNSDVKIDVSTPNGEGNPFWKKRHGGKIKVFVFDWRDDPRKDDDWYQAQKEKLEPWILAQEVDRDYSASKQGVCIPAIYVRAAIDFEMPTQGAVVAGLDVADEEGEDINVMIIRRGVKIIKISDWNGIDTTQTAREAINLCNENLVDMMNYDSIGVGAGVRGEVKSLKAIHTSEGRRFPLVVPVNVGSTKMYDMYTQDKADADMFVNIKAALWWRLRRRFERTYEHVNGIKTWPMDELISIPRHDELISELSRPLREINEAGKIRIEPKPKMKLRGLKSPNFADALVLSFANPGLIPVHANMGGVMSEPAQIERYVTGKTKIPPGVLKNKPRGNRYVDFGDDY